MVFEGTSSNEGGMEEAKEIEVRNPSWVHKT